MEEGVISLQKTFTYLYNGVDFKIFSQCLWINTLNGVFIGEEKKEKGWLRWRRGRKHGKKTKSHISDADDGWWWQRSSVRGL